MKAGDIVAGVATQVQERLAPEMDELRARIEQLEMLMRDLAGINEEGSEDRAVVLPQRQPGQSQASLYYQRDKADAAKMGLTVAEYRRRRVAANRSRSEPVPAPAPSPAQPVHVPQIQQVEDINPGL